MLPIPKETGDPPRCLQASTIPTLSPSCMDHRLCKGQEYFTSCFKDRRPLSSFRGLKPIPGPGQVGRELEACPAAVGLLPHQAAS